MIDVMPKKLIKQKDLNNWSYYSKFIISKCYVKKYLEKILKKCVENLYNPMEIPWLRNDKILIILNNNLKLLENKIGEENIKLLFKEFDNEVRSTKAILRKINSLEGEILALNKIFIKFDESKWKKIDLYGDWENKTTIISVKSKNTIDSNYAIIENVITGMIYIEENDVLRRYSKINLINGKNLNDEFLNNIISFLQSSLLSNLIQIDKKLTSNHSFDNRTEYNQNLNVLIDSYVNNRNNNINFIFSNSNGNSLLEIKFECNKYPATLSIDYDTNTFWDLENFNLDKISFKEYFEKFEKSFEKINKNKNFIGCISILVHPMYHEYVLKNFENIENSLRKIFGSRKYDIYFCFIFQMNFDAYNENIIYIKNS